MNIPLLDDLGNASLNYELRKLSAIYAIRSETLISLINNLNKLTMCRSKNPAPTKEKVKRYLQQKITLSMSNNYQYFRQKLFFVITRLVSKR